MTPEGHDRMIKLPVGRRNRGGIWIKEITVRRGHHRPANPRTGGQVFLRGGAHRQRIRVGDRRPRRRWIRNHLENFNSLTSKILHFVMKISTFELSVGVSTSSVDIRYLNIVRRGRPIGRGWRSHRWRCSPIRDRIISISSVADWSWRGWTGAPDWLRWRGSNGDWPTVDR